MTKICSVLLCTFGELKFCNWHLGDPIKMTVYSGQCTLTYGENLLSKDMIMDKNYGIN